MNDLQKQTIEELKEDLYRSAHTTIKLFIDGKMQVYDGSFLRELLCGQIEPPVILPERNSFGQWIDIKDELPPFGKGILVTDNEHIICCELEKSGKDIWLDGHNFGGYEWEWDEIFRYENIKKWMPLPKL